MSRRQPHRTHPGAGEPIPLPLYLPISEKRSCARHLKSPPAAPAAGRRWEGIPGAPERAPPAEGAPSAAPGSRAPSGPWSRTGSSRPCPQRRPRRRRAPGSRPPGAAAGGRPGTPRRPSGASSCLRGRKGRRMGKRKGLGTCARGAGIGNARRSCKRPKKVGEIMGSRQWGTPARRS